MPQEREEADEIQSQHDDTDPLDDSDVVWQEVEEDNDEPTRLVGVPASRAAPRGWIDLINYNDEKLPVWSKELHHYSEHAQRTWMTGFGVTAVIMLLMTYLPIPSFVALLTLGLGMLVTQRSVESLKKDFAWDVERRRGTDTKSAYESVEWMNHVLKSVWPLLDTELFVAGIDLIEDALKALSPAVVRTVRIGAVAQGANAMRILGIRHLPDDFDITSVQLSPDQEPIKGRLGGGLREEPGQDPGRWINVEAQFSYRKLPPPHSQANQMHMVIHMGFGVRKIIKFEVPIWVELRGLHGRIRLRMEMIADPPFVRHVQFTFPESPTLEIVAKPLRTLNVMTLPVLSGYVFRSIQQVLKLFTAPKSYTVDLSRFFLGSDVALKTRTIGVVCVVIHEARHLLAADFNGSSDPYVLVSFANVGKSLYATKVKKDSLNPIFEELAIVKITQEELDEEDDIRLSIMDHDRYSKNDLLGSVLVALKQLHATPGEWHRDSAVVESAKHRKEGYAGTLRYSAAFFPLSKVIETEEDTSNSSSKQDDTLSPQGTNDDRPASKRSSSNKSTAEPRPSYSHRSDPNDSLSAAYAARMRAMLDGRLPAKAHQQTGIISFQVHQVAELFCSSGSQRRVRETKEEEALPSSYVNVFLDDEQIYRTRLKPLTSAPYFNAGSEVVCRDWTKARLDFAVMDYRDRDHDVLIGYHSCLLSDVLAQRTHLSTWKPIFGGMGTGRLRFSILYKPLDLRLPKPLLEWSIGTLEIVHARARGLPHDLVGRLSVEIEGSGSASTNSDVSMEDSPGSSARQLQWDPDEPLRLPFFSRLVPVTFDIESVSTLRSTTKFSAELWLTTVGSDDTKLEIPLRESGDTRVSPAIALPQAPPRRRRNKQKKADQSRQDPASSSSPRLSGPQICGPGGGEDSDDPSSPLHTPSRTPHTPTEHYTEAQPPATAGVLELTVRWSRGLDHVHEDAVLSGTAALRASYELFSKRTQQLERERKRSIGQNDDAADTESSEWVVEGDSNADGVEAGSLRPKLKTFAHAKRKMDKMRMSQGGTAKWMAHGVQLAKRKVQGMNKHNVAAPAPEQEIQSAL